MITSIVMIVYNSRRYGVRRYKYYGGSGIMDMIESFLARSARKPMLATAAKKALRDTLDAANKAIPHLIAHKAAVAAVQRSKGKKEPQ